MEVYAGLLLAALGIAYLVVRSSQSRKTGELEKNERNVSRRVLNLSNRSKQKGSLGSASSVSRGKQSGRTLRRSALVAGTVQKPWGW